MTEEMLQNETYYAYWALLVSNDPRLAIVGTCLNPFQAWICASLCSALVGLTGLLPIFILSDKVGERRLRMMLSFGCGSMLSNVFLHLLPEAQKRLEGDVHWGHISLGLWILCGILTFVILEMFARAVQGAGSEGGGGGGGDKKQIAVAGYLNLLANCADNFTHGLAVGGAFMVDLKTGFLTTGCILLHEIPHEIGDFAILMKSGFDAERAARYQLYTASLGIVGAFLALGMDGGGGGGPAAGGWVIPFTCGGFVQIALVNVLPDLLKSDSIEDFFIVIGGIVSGIVVIFLCTGF